MASAGVIAYGRGYRLNLKKPTELLPTGIVTATSDPVAAQVLVDGQLKTATNNSFNLPPDWYTVTIRKEGYQPWEKRLRVQGEVVTRADAYLFPTSPSLSPITTSGILSPAVSPDGTTVAYLVPTKGLYTLELADRSLGGRNRDPKLVAQRAFAAAATIQWSPDGTKILVTEQNINTVYDLTKSPAQILPLTETADWPAQAAQRDRAKLASLPQPIIAIATSSAKLLAFSPDETKLLYEATSSATIPRVLEPPLIGTNPTEEIRNVKAGNLYVYDSREDRNYFLLQKKEIPSTPPLWFPTSRHILLVGNNKIDVMEYDRTNWITLYAGPFAGGFLAPWPSGGRLVILTNLNPGASTLPNLYTVNLR